MFGKPSIWTRIAVGKLAGMVIGVIALIALTQQMPYLGWAERIGFLLWYTTLGAFVGLFGVINYHPVLKMPMPWWFRAPLVGAWMNLLLTLLAADLLAEIMEFIFGENSVFSSPWWFVVEGAVVGLLIGYLATKFGGEGPETNEYPPDGS